MGWRQHKKITGRMAIGRQPLPGFEYNRNKKDPVNVWAYVFNISVDWQEWKGFAFIVRVRDSNDNIISGVKSKKVFDTAEECKEECEKYMRSKGYIK